MAPKFKEDIIKGIQPRNLKLADIISEVQDKVTALKLTRGFAVIPVLFHIAAYPAMYKLVIIFIEL